MCPHSQDRAPSQSQDYRTLTTLSMWVAKAKVLDSPSSSAFPGTLAGSFMGSRATSTDQELKLQYNS